MFMPLEARCDV